MRYLLVISLFFLSGCNSLDAVSRVIDAGNKLGIDYDTNGYGFNGGRTKPHQKICEVRTGPNTWAWKPCK